MVYVHTICTRLGNLLYFLRLDDFRLWLLDVELGKREIIIIIISLCCIIIYYNTILNDYQKVMIRHCGFLKNLNNKVAKNPMKIAHRYFPIGFSASRELSSYFTV